MNQHSQPSKKQPIAKFSAWPVEVAVWSNEVRRANGETIELPRITVQKSYRTEKGYAEAGAFDAYDLPKLAVLIGKAYEFCLLEFGQGRRDNHERKHDRNEQDPHRRDANHRRDQ